MSSASHVELSWNCSMQHVETPLSEKVSKRSHRCSQYAELISNPLFSYKPMHREVTQIVLINKHIIVTGCLLMATPGSSLLLDSLLKRRPSAMFVMGMRSLMRMNSSISCDAATSALEKRRFHTVLSLDQSATMLKLLLTRRLSLSKSAIHNVCCNIVNTVQ
jgi:hypothetical protein